MIKFSLLGETILEWNDKDIEHYHAHLICLSFIRHFFMRLSVASVVFVSGA